MATLYPTPLDKLRARTRLTSGQFALVVAVLLLLILFLALAIDGETDAFFTNGTWRATLLPPVIILYILLLVGPMTSYRSGAVEAFRELVQLSDDAFNHLVQEVSDVDDRNELIAFLVSASFGVWAYGPWHMGETGVWIKAYMVIAGTVMFGLLGWVAFSSLAGTKLDGVLHTQPLNIDIFDIRPFYPIGRHSLFTSLAFVGGSVISVLIINPLRGDFSIAALGVYGALGLVSLLVFFLGTRHTHRVLAAAKERENRIIQHHIAALLRSLENEGKDAGAIGDELSLWLKYEERLKGTRTWPYNTTMLRTVFMSVLFPIIASQAQRIIGNWLSG